MKRETTTGPTPGPWTVGWVGPVGAPHSLGRPCVGTVGCDDWVGPEGAEADAVLIAAAPDLYAALREVQRALACDRDGIPYAHPVHGRITLEEVKYTVVDPALSRAEGKGGAR